jgi:hypothetical protein
MVLYTVAWTGGVGASALIIAFLYEPRDIASTIPELEVLNHRG